MIRIKRFADYAEFEKYSDKLEERGRCFPENVMTMIESDSHISVDVTVSCKKKKTAVKRFFEAVKDFPALMDWEGTFDLDTEDDEHIRDERFNYMTGRNDYTGNYSIEIENQEGSFYISMNVSKEYKELTGLQYDFDHHADKSIEWIKQTEKINEALIEHYEHNQSGEWIFKFGKTIEIIKNIKIAHLHRDRIKNEINFSYNYTTTDFNGLESNWYMSVTSKSGKITYSWSSDKFNGMAEAALNEEILNRIIQLIPEFHYLPVI